MSRIQFIHTYNDIISIENLLEAWKEFIKGKRKRKDIQEFSLNLFDNLVDLHQELSIKAYRHGLYESFNINDPIPRNIHKATVKDRLLHHAVYRVLYPFFDKTFISDSFSCRVGKGTHKALKKFRQYGYKISKNNTKACWILKCDIRKFFASINHNTLLSIVSSYIEDENIMWLIEKIVSSFDSGNHGVGLPIGNLTSQLFVNIYMNEFDQYMKNRLRHKYYIRYADDFVIFSRDKKFLQSLLLDIKEFLNIKLKLTLHPNKIYLKTLSSGIDFLGWVNFFNHRVMRTSTKRRCISRIKLGVDEQTLNSYIGLLKHGNTYKILQFIKTSYILKKC